MFWVENYQSCHYIDTQQHVFENAVNAKMSSTKIPYIYF